MIKILRNPKTEDYKFFKKRVTSPDFPWSYFEETHIDGNVFNSDFRDIPFYSHCVLERPNKKVPFTSVNSTEIELCVKVFDQIMEYNKLHYKVIYRININSTFYVDNKISPPHVDHDYPHNSLILYLNSFTSGKTHVFHRKFPYPESEIKFSDMKYSFKGEEDDIITFDGLHYHCVECPDKNQRRIVMVVTYLT